MFPVIEVFLCSGPVLHFPVIHVEVGLHSLHIGPGTSLAMVSACAAQCVTKALHEAHTGLLEPMMKLEVGSA